MLLYPGELRVPRSLEQRLRSERFEITFDTAFERVIAACAAPRADDEGTWITPAMIRAYTRLHREGVAHSVEAWRDGKLAGGLYGLAFGAAFCGESMFHRETDASKVAFATLARRLEAAGFHFIDCQLETSHLASLGARPVSRARYLTELAAARSEPDRWSA